MLDGRVAVLHQRDVHREQRTALGHHFHIFSQCSGDDHLSLIAARLVVVLHAVRALCLQPADIGQRILIGVDLRIDARCLRAIDDFARREDTRGQDDACPLHLGGGEDVGCTGRRIVDRRGAHRQIGKG